MTSLDDTVILKCYRCYNEWETYSYRQKWDIKKCTLCHRPMCKTCMYNKEYKQLCLCCEINPYKRECWICGWKSPGFAGSYKQLVYLYMHLNIFHYGKKYYGKTPDFLRLNKE